jgi:menaquinone-dependent protoporphyrinogen IX oxidase
LKLLDVRQVAVFPGKLDLEATDWQERWTLAARYDGHTWPSGFDGDFRDWDKVRTWAGEIARELLAVKTT